RMRNTEETKLALNELLLNSNSAAPLPAPVIEELSQLLGLTLAMEALGTEVPGPRRESTLAFPVLDWRPESQFNWHEPAAGRSPAAPEGEPKRPGSIDSWKAGPALHDRDVAVNAWHGASSEIIGRIAESAGVPCVWTRAAREAADRRIVD